MERHMTLGIDQYRANLAWLHKQRDKYPFECETKLAWPKVEHVKQLMSGLGIATCELPKTRIWLFKTEDAMMRFKQNFTTLDNKS
jgi:hypothetical protein